MFNFETVHDFGMKQFEAASSASSTAVKGFQAITAEALDYSRKSWDSNRALAQKILQAKNLTDLIEIQSNFVKETYGEFTSRTSQLNKLYFDLGKENFERWTQSFSHRK